MKHRCKICGKLDIGLRHFGKHGWLHIGCLVFDWQRSIKETEYHEILSEKLSHEITKLNRVIDALGVDK